MNLPNATPNSDLADQLRGSLLLFTKYFFNLRTQVDFIPSKPEGRESHYITISKALTRSFRGDSKRVLINVPPRYGKTELLCNFIAWSWARYPDSNFLYVSVTYELATKATQKIRDILNLPQYQQLFGVHLDPDSSAVGNFRVVSADKKNKVKGTLEAVGAEGTIVGKGAGVKGVDRFGGCIVIDDIHKPDEVIRSSVREKIRDWYFNTLSSRLNDPRKTPIIFIGQRLHEDDLAGKILEGFDGYDWDKVILPMKDEYGRMLDLDRHTSEDFDRMIKADEYVAASQCQQTPIPAGGGIYKEEDFCLLKEEPEIISTFITCDTAETTKTVNDASVFSFWGLYRIKNEEAQTDVLGLHWIDCDEFRVEPKELEYRFHQFYMRCMRHRIKPNTVAIEKKSTGVTLASVLSDLRGIRVLEIPRNVAHGSKLDRFLRAQPYIYSKRVSLTEGDSHVEKCINHMTKITNNNSHMHDDICDTVADAVDIALIDRSIICFTAEDIERSRKKSKMFSRRVNHRLPRFTREGSQRVSF